MTAIGLARQVEPDLDVITSVQRVDRLERKMAVRVVDLMEKIDDMGLASEPSDELASMCIETTQLGDQAHDVPLDLPLGMGSVDSRGGA
jgi:hypothetical protein